MSLGFPATMMSLKSTTRISLRRPIAFVFLFLVMNASIMLSFNIPTTLVKQPLHSHFHPMLAKSAKGFGSSESKTGTSAASVSGQLKTKALSPWKISEPRDQALEKAVTDMDVSHSSSNNLLHYLNPKYTNDASVLESISYDLKQGKIVVLKDALDPTLAEVTHRDLRSPSAPWQLNEHYFDDGYAFRHENIFNREVWTSRLNKTMNIFESKETREWMSKLSGRDCLGETTGAPSYYRPGFYSLPHTDWAGQRTVAYVWHLSKDWKPEFGGGLYWCSNDHSKAYFHASFNTLVLFGVTTHSSHFVTTVSPSIPPSAKRLTFNGWYQSTWTPKPSDDFESMLDTPEKRRGVTHTQLQIMSDLVGDRFARFESPAKRQQLASIKDQIMQEFF